MSSRDNPPAFGSLGNSQNRTTSAENAGSEANKKASATGDAATGQKVESGERWKGDGTSTNNGKDSKQKAEQEKTKETSKDGKVGAVRSLDFSEVLDNPYRL